MVIADIMSKNPVTILSNRSLREALEMMETNEFHHLPVLSTDKHLVGIITARDCRLALMLPDLSPEYWRDEDTGHDVLVNTIMSVAPIVVEAQTSINAAAKLLVTQYVSCLPVMKGETLIGIVTLTDLLIAFVKMYESENSTHI